PCDILSVTSCLGPSSLSRALPVLGGTYYPGLPGRCPRQNAAPICKPFAMCCGIRLPSLSSTKGESLSRNLFGFLCSQPLVALAGHHGLPSRVNWAGFPRSVCRSEERRVGKDGK